MLPQAHFMAGQARAKTLAVRKQPICFARGHCSLFVWLYSCPPRPNKCAAITIANMCRITAQKKRMKKIKIVLGKNLFNVRISAQKLSTGMPEVFENENSFVCRKIVIGNVSAAIGTNYRLAER